MPHCLLLLLILLEVAAASNCVAPTTTTGYDSMGATETSLAISGFDVTGYACANSFIGTAKATACSSAGSAYILSGCTPKAARTECPVSPSLASTLPPKADDIPCTTKADCLDTPFFSDCEDKICVLHVRTFTWGDAMPAEALNYMGVYDYEQYRVRHYYRGGHELLDSGEVDISFTSSIRAAASYARGEDVTFLRPGMSPGASEGIVIKKSIKGVSDLKGKTLAVGYGGTSHYSLASILDQTGLTGQVEVQNIGDSGQMAPFLDGTLDGYYTFGDYYANGIKKAGGHSIFDSSTASKWGKESSLVHFIRNPFLKAHPRFVANFLKLTAVNDNHYLKHQKSKNLGPWGDEGALIASVTNVLGWAPAKDMYEYLAVTGIYSSEVLRGCSQMGMDCADKSQISGMSKQLFDNGLFSYAQKFTPWHPVSPQEYHDHFTGPTSSVATEFNMVDDLCTEDNIQSLQKPWETHEFDTSGSCVSGTPVELTVTSTPTIIADDDKGGTGTYDLNLNCEWIITPETGMSGVRIEFETFSTQRGKDFVEIREVATKNLVIKLTGREWDPNYHGASTPSLPSVIGRGALQVLFHSNGKHHQPDGRKPYDDGWRAKIFAVSEVSTNGGGGNCAADSGLFGADCQFKSCVGTTSVAIDSAGKTFRSNSEQSQYSNNAECTWILTAPENSHAIDIHFDSFAVRDIYEDVVTIKDASKKVLVKLDGKTLHPFPSSFRVIGTTAFIDFQSDDRVTDSGFVATAKSVATAGCATTPCVKNQGSCDEDTNECVCLDGFSGHDCSSSVCVGESKLRKEGFISSNAISQSNAYADRHECSWNLERPTTTDTHGIGFTIERFDVELYDEFRSNEVTTFGDNFMATYSRTDANGKDVVEDWRITSAINTTNQICKTECQVIQHSTKKYEVQFQQGCPPCTFAMCSHPEKKLGNDLTTLLGGSTEIGAQCSQGTWKSIKFNFNSDMNRNGKGFLINYAPLRKCPFDQYRYDQRNIHECRPCEPGKRPNIDQSECEDAPWKISSDCKTKEFLDDTSENRLDHECTVCPPGAICLENEMTEVCGSGRGDALSTMCSRPGHWRANSTTAEFLECPYRTACNGGFFITPDAYYDEKSNNFDSGENSTLVRRVREDNVNSTNMSDIQCSSGSTGVLCAVCKKGFVRNFKGSCDSCPTFSEETGTVVVLVVFVILMFAVFVTTVIQISLFKAEKKAMANALMTLKESNGVSYRYATMNGTPLDAPYCCDVCYDVGMVQGFDSMQKLLKHKNAEAFFPVFMG